jgi:hypothetical protein
LARIHGNVLLARVTHESVATLAEMESTVHHAIIGVRLMARNTHVRFRGVDDAATYALPEIKTDFFFINFEKVLVDPEALPEFIKLVGIVYDATS